MIELTRRQASLKHIMKSMIPRQCMNIFQLECDVIYSALDLLLQKRKLGGKADTVGKVDKL